MPNAPITSDWPESGEGITITFPKSKSDPLRSHVLEHVAQPEPHLLLAAPIVDGEATVASNGEAILMKWQSNRATRSLAGTVDGFVDRPIAAWRVSVGEVGRRPVDRSRPVDQVDAVTEGAPAATTNRRRHVRVPLKRRVEIIVAGRKTTCETVDISESGVRCRWRGDPFWAPSRGSSVTVSLEISPGRPVALTGNVVRVRTVSGEAELSVAFTHRHESSQTVQLLRRYVVALERRQLVQDQERS